MLDVNINFQIFCTRPGWAITNPNPKYTDTRYRIYLDENLITERSWIWDNNIALHEEIFAKIDLQQDHRLRLDPITYSDNQAAFEMHYLRSAGREFVVIKAVTPLDILFRIA
jgi:hypothetical protein